MNEKAPGYNHNEIISESERSALLVALARFSNSKYEDDASLYVLLNPSPQEIRQMVRSFLTEAKLRRFDITKVPFKGFRAIKFQKGPNEKPLCIIWPSFCWTHNQVKLSAAEAIPEFQVFDGAVRFYFDVAKQTISSETMNHMINWIHEPLSAPTPNRSVREDE